MSASAPSFRQFLLQTNALALAIGVVIGAAVSRLVEAFVSGMIMPVVGLALPGGAWRELAVPLGQSGNALAIGPVLGAVVDFAIIAWVVYVVATRVMRTAPPA